MQGCNMKANYERLNIILRRIQIACIALMVIFIVLMIFQSCKSSTGPTVISPQGTPILTTQDIQTLMAQAVEQAVRLNEKINVAVLDRENIGIFHLKAHSPLQPRHNRYSAKSPKLAPPHI
jgi:hypothetical protein